MKKGEERYDEQLSDYFSDQLLDQWLLATEEKKILKEELDPPLSRRSLPC